MSSSSYWKGQLDYYQNNRPASYTSYYNQSFVDKINEAQKDIDSLVSEQDKAWNATQAKQDEYNAFSGNMSSYGDVYKSAENEFGVSEAQGNYEKSKKALAMAETTLNALPSSINASSNRVLTQSQREARYNTLSDKYMKHRDSLESRTSMYEDVWKNARQNQADYAQAEIAAQWKKLSDYNNSFTEAMNEYSKIGSNLLDAKSLKREWESDYRSWQLNQRNIAYEAWSNNLSAALSRYQQALNTELTLKKAQATIDASSKYEVKNIDFGNGYTIRGGNGQQAQYLYNGKSISAGQFLENTGANGVNWNAWNSVWNSGIKTSGVGSDTVSAFNMRTQVGSQYSYLWR